MIRSMIGRLLQSWLGNYVESFTDSVENERSGTDISGIEWSLWDGSLTLQNVVLKKNVLDTVQVPLRLKSGFIGQLVIHIPWSKLQSESIHLEFCDMLLLVEPTAEDVEDIDIALNRHKQAMLKRMEILFMTRLKSLLMVQEEAEGFGTGFLHNLTSNLRFSFARSTLHIEDTDLCYGIDIGSVIYETTDALKNPAFAHRDPNAIFSYKRFSIEALTVYTFSAGTSSIDFLRPADKLAVNDMMQEKTVIVPAFDIVVFIRSVSKHHDIDVPRIQIEMELANLRLQSSMQNLLLLHRLLEKLTRRPTHIGVLDSAPRLTLRCSRPEKRPSRNDPKAMAQWWKYSAYMACLQHRARHPSFFHRTGFFGDFKDYIPMYQRKLQGGNTKQEVKHMNTIESRWNFQQMAFLRIYAFNGLLRAQKHRELDSQSSVNMLGFLTNWIFSSKEGRVSEGDISESLEVSLDAFQRGSTTTSSMSLVLGSCTVAIHSHGTYALNTVVSGIHVVQTKKIHTQTLQLSVHTISITDVSDNTPILGFTQQSDKTEEETSVLEMNKMTLFPQNEETQWTTENINFRMEPVSITYTQHLLQFFCHLSVVERTKDSKTSTHSRYVLDILIRSPSLHLPLSSSCTASLMIDEIVLVGGFESPNWSSIDEFCNLEPQIQALYDLQVLRVQGCRIIVQTQTNNNAFAHELLQAWTVNIQVAMRRIRHIGSPAVLLHCKAPPLYLNLDPGLTCKLLTVLMQVNTSLGSRKPASRWKTADAEQEAAVIDVKIDSILVVLGSKKMASFSSFVDTLHCKLVSRAHDSEILVQIHGIVVEHTGEHIREVFSCIPFEDEETAVSGTISRFHAGSPLYTPLEQEVIFHVGNVTLNLNQAVILDAIQMDMVRSTQDEHEIESDVIGPSFYNWVLETNESALDANEAALISSHMLHITSFLTVLEDGDLAFAQCVARKLNVSRKGYATGSNVASVSLDELNVAYLEKDRSFPILQSRSKEKGSVLDYSQIAIQKKLHNMDYCRKKTSLRLSPMLCCLDSSFFSQTLSLLSSVRQASTNELQARPKRVLEAFSIDIEDQIVMIPLNVASVPQRPSILVSVHSFKMEEPVVSIADQGITIAQKASLNHVQVMRSPFDREASAVPIMDSFDGAIRFSSTIHSDDRHHINRSMEASHIRLFVSLHDIEKLRETVSSFSRKMASHALHSRDSSKQEHGKVDICIDTTINIAGSVAHLMDNSVQRSILLRIPIQPTRLTWMESNTHISGSCCAAFHVEDVFHADDERDVSCILGSNEGNRYIDVKLTFEKSDSISYRIILGHVSIALESRALPQYVQWLYSLQGNKESAPKSGASMDTTVVFQVDVSAVMRDPFGVSYSLHGAVDGTMGRKGQLMRSRADLREISFSMGRIAEDSVSTLFNSLDVSIALDSLPSSSQQYLSIIQESALLLDVTFRHITQAFRTMNYIRSAIPEAPQQHNTKILQHSFEFACQQQIVLMLTNDTPGYFLPFLRLSIPSYSLNAQKIGTLIQDLTLQFNAGMEYRNMENRAWEAVIEPLDILMKLNDDASHCRLLQFQSSILNVNVTEQMIRSCSINQGCFQSFVLPRMQTGSAVKRSVTRDSLDFHTSIVLHNETGTAIQLRLDADVVPLTTVPHQGSFAVPISSVSDGVQYSEHRSTYHLLVCGDHGDWEYWEPLDKLTLSQDIESCFLVPKDKRRAEKCRLKVLFSVVARIDGITTIHISSCVCFLNQSSLLMQLQLGHDDQEYASYTVQPGSRFYFPFHCLDLSQGFNSFRVRPLAKDPFQYSSSFCTRYEVNRKSLFSPRPIWCQSPADKTRYWFSLDSSMGDDEATYVLTLRPPFQIRNALPVPVTAVCHSKEGTDSTLSLCIEKNETASVYTMNPICGVQLTLHLETFPGTAAFSIPAGEPVIGRHAQEGVLCDAQGLELGLRLDTRTLSRTCFESTLFVPSWHEDKTGLGLHLASFEFQSQEPISLCGQSTTRTRVPHSFYVYEDESCSDLYLLTKAPWYSLFEARKRHRPSPGLLQHAHQSQFKEQTNTVLCGLDAGLQSAALCVKVDGTFWSDPFYLNTLEGGHITLVQDADGHRIAYDLAFHVMQHECCLTRIFTYTPRFILENCSSHRIELRQRGSTQYEMLQSSESKPVFRSNANQPCHFQFKFKEYGWDWSGYVSIDNPGTFAVSVRNTFTHDTTILRFSCVPVQTSFHIQLTEDTTYAPYRIENYTYLSLEYRQTGVRAANMVLPYHASNYAWDEPLKAKRVRVRAVTDAGSHEIGSFSLDKIAKYRPVSLYKRRRKLGFAVASMPLSKEIRVQVFAEGPVRVMRITDSLVDSSGLDDDAAEQLDQGYRFRCQINLRGIGISLIETSTAEPPREVVYMLASGFQLEYHSQTHSQEVRAKVGALQVDHQCSDAIFPVLVHPLYPDKQPLFDLHVIRNKSYSGDRNVFISLLTLQSNPIVLKLDEAFMSRLLYLVRRYAFMIRTSTASSGSETQPVAIYIQTMVIYPIQVSVTFSSSGSMHPLTNADRNILVVLWRAMRTSIANIEEAFIFLNAYSKNDVFYGNVGEFKTEIQRYYRSLIIREGYKLIGSSGFMGNPFGLVSRVKSGLLDLVNEPYQALLTGRSFYIAIGRGSLSLVFNFIYGVANTCNIFSDSMSKGLLSVTLHRDESILYPTNPFAGVCYGMQAMISAPLEGYRRSRLFGFTYGMLAGFISLGLLPIVGSVNMLNTAFVTIKNTTDMSITKRRLRHPRIFRYGDQLCPYSEYGDPQLIEFWDQYTITKLENKEIFCDFGILQGKGMMLVTSRFIIILDSFASDRKRRVISLASSVSSLLYVNRNAEQLIVEWEGVSEVMVYHFTTAHDCAKVYHAIKMLRSVH